MASRACRSAFGKPANELPTKLPNHLLSMPDCPRCHQPVDARAIACAHCKTPLKAFGHPGIPLYRSQPEEFLCTTCIYHEDDTCNYPQRPFAKECTLYHDRAEPLVPADEPLHQRRLATINQKLVSAPSRLVSFIRFNYY